MLLNTSPRDLPGSSKPQPSFLPMIHLEQLCKLSLEWFMFLFECVKFSTACSNVPHLRLNQPLLGKLQKKSVAAMCSFAGYESESVVLQFYLLPPVSKPNVNLLSFQVHRLKLLGYSLTCSGASCPTLPSS